MRQLVRERVRAPEVASIRIRNQPLRGRTTAVVDPALSRNLLQRIRVTRTCRVAATLAAICPSGCTSLTWEDSDGVRHHFGLVAQQTVEFDCTTRVRRYALGSDLDLSPDGAWTVGHSSSECVRTPPITVAAAEDLADAYVAFLDSAPTAEEPRVGWKILWFTEGACVPAVVRRSAYGVAIGWAPALQGLVAGYGSGDHLRVDIVGGDSVVCSRRREGQPPSYRWWRLRD